MSRSKHFPLGVLPSRVQRIALVALLLTIAVAQSVLLNADDDRGAAKRPTDAAVCSSALYVLPINPFAKASPGDWESIFIVTQGTGEDTGIVVTTVMTIEVMKRDGSEVAIAWHARGGEAPLSTETFSTEELPPLLRYLQYVDERSDTVDRRWELLEAHAAPETKRVRGHDFDCIRIEARARGQHSYRDLPGGEWVTEVSFLIWVSDTVTARGLVSVSIRERTEHWDTTRKRIFSWHGSETRIDVLGYGSRDATLWGGRDP